MDGKPLTTADKQDLLRKLAARASELLAPQLERLFAGCQTHFFELASASDSGANRPRYLGFVRELKRAKPVVSADFAARIDADFARLGGAAGSAAPSVLAAGSDEERVANAARNACRNELDELHQRLRTLAAAPLEARDVPLDPARVLAAFLDACPALAQDASIRTPLSAQLDQHVLRGLDAVCRSLSALVPEAAKPTPTPAPAKPAPVPAKPAPSRPGAEPDPSSEWLDAAFRGGAPAPETTGMAPAAAALFGTARPASSGGAAATAPAAPAAAPAGALAATGIDPVRDLQEISGLLQRLRGVPGTLAAGGEGAAAAGPSSVMLPLVGVGGAASGPAISGDQFVALLSDVQTRGSWRGGSASEAVDIRGAIQAIAAAKGNISVGQAEQDMVDIVTMFFDLIIEDRDLPSTVQALLQRLQLPVLKIALTDRAFFTDRTHPARALIDAIARVGVGWDTTSKQEQDSLLTHMNGLLEELLAHPALGVDAFKLALIKLNEHTSRADQRAIKQERRTAEKVQAEARLTAAREEVHEVLRERLDGRELPEPLLEFFTRDWQRVLQLTWLRQGKDSAQWRDAVAAIEELVRSTESNAPAEAGEALYARLESGLAMTQSNTGDAQERVAAIRAMHRARAQPPEPGSSTPPVTTTRAHIELPPPIAARTPSAPITTPAPPRTGEALSIESLKRVDEMPIGTWFEYEDPASRATRRCKLSARIDETRMFLFSDRLGMPVHQKPRKQFAHELQLGLVRVIEDAPLVDRTIGRIAATLRERAGETAS